MDRIFVSLANGLSLYIEEFMSYEDSIYMKFSSSTQSFYYL